MKKILMIATFLGLVVATTAVAADSKENWTKNCVKCHGADGKGDTKPGHKLNIKDLSDAKVQASFTDEEAFKALKEGLNDKEGKVRMKPVENMTDDEIKDLVKLVRGLKS